VSRRLLCPFVLGDSLPVARSLPSGLCFSVGGRARPLAVAPWKVLALQPAPSRMADVTPRESAGGTEVIGGANRAGVGDGSLGASIGGCACGGDVPNGGTRQGGIGKKCA
jgi:hypothetical protein